MSKVQYLIKSSVPLQDNLEGPTSKPEKKITPAESYSAICRISCSYYLSLFSSWQIILTGTKQNNHRVGHA